MPDNYLLTAEAISDIEETNRIVRSLAPFSGKTEENREANKRPASIHGYLMQTVADGGSGLMARTVHNIAYRSFKLDVAGIVFKDTDGAKSLFQLRFMKDRATWFDTEVLPIAGLGIVELLDAIVRASVDSNGAFQITPASTTGALGNPTVHPQLVTSGELYPALDDTYKSGQPIFSKIGSWLFCIHRKVLPDTFDIDLLFTTTGTVPTTLSGPAVMTLHEVKDVPTGDFDIVTDVLNIANPTPLQGGTKLAATYFDDVGYGIIAANPREYFFEQMSTP